MAETDPKHPIILSADSRVIDGMHRVCKALNLGHETVRAVRFDSMPEPDHIDADLEALPYDEPWWIGREFRHIATYTAILSGDHVAHLTQPEWLGCAR